MYMYSIYIYIHTHAYIHTYIHISVCMYPLLVLAFRFVHIWSYLTPAQLAHNPCKLWIYMPSEPGLLSNQGAKV